MFELIRQAAQQARSGSEADVRHLAETITAAYVSIIPLKDLLDAGITKLQLQFLVGQTPAVNEGSLVTALNHLADRIAMPSYGRTNPLEFRLLRILLLKLVPELNPAVAAQVESFSPKANPQTALSPEMTPMEAAFFTCILALQKRTNPDYQKTEEESRQSYQSGIEKWAQRLQGTEPELPYLISSPPSDPERKDAIRAAFHRFAQECAHPGAMEAEIDNFFREAGVLP